MEKRVYFLSDAHLGFKDLPNDRDRELLLVHFLDEIKESAASIWILGDLFDFWFEYKNVIPKGQARLIGKLCELTDSGVEVHLFTGNHDIWTFDYLSEECGVTIHRAKYETVTLLGQKLVIGHGDGLDPNERGYRIIRAIFHNRFAQSCFKLLHPDLGVAFARRWSNHSRNTRRDGSESISTDGSANGGVGSEVSGEVNVGGASGGASGAGGSSATTGDSSSEGINNGANGGATGIYNGESSSGSLDLESESIVQFCRHFLREDPSINYFVFGHRHIPMDIQLSDTCRYINTGDWITNFSYATLSSSGMELTVRPFLV